jgi:hypothetical protein
MGVGLEILILWSYNASDANVQFSLQMRNTYFWKPRENTPKLAHVAPKFSIIIHRSLVCLLCLYWSHKTCFQTTHGLCPDLEGKWRFIKILKKSNSETPIRSWIWGNGGVHQVLHIKIEGQLYWKIESVFFHLMHFFFGYSLNWQYSFAWYISSLDIHWIEFSIDFWKLVKNPKNAGGECV